MRNSRGYRQIIPTQAAWAYVNDIKYNYYNIFLTKNGKILYVRLIYCIYIVLFYLYPLRSIFFRFAKIHQINFSQFAKGEPETLLLGKGYGQSINKFLNYAISRNKCTGSISIP